MGDRAPKGPNKYFLISILCLRIWALGIIVDQTRVVFLFLGTLPLSPGAWPGPFQYCPSPSRIGNPAATHDGYRTNAKLHLQIVMCRADEYGYIWRHTSETRHDSSMFAYSLENNKQKVPMSIMTRSDELVGVHQYNCSQRRTQYFSIGRSVATANPNYHQFPFSARNFNISGSRKGQIFVLGSNFRNLPQFQKSHRILRLSA